MLLFNFSRYIRIVVALCILSAAPAFGLTLHELTKDYVEFEWQNSDTRTEYFEVRLRWLDLDITPALVTEITKINKEVFTAKLNRPRLGHWAVEVRACAMLKYKCTDGVLTSDFDPQGTNPVCSDWQKSDIVGAPSPWAVYWKPPSVFNINISDYVVP